jgi:hypothetical protein
MPYKISGFCHGVAEVILPGCCTVLGVVTDVLDSYAVLKCLKPGTILHHTTTQNSKDFSHALFVI